MKMTKMTVIMIGVTTDTSRDVVPFSWINEMKKQWFTCYFGLQQ